MPLDDITARVKKKLHQITSIKKYNIFLIGKNIFFLYKLYKK